jgi:vancomycin resistance protein YoaR
MVHARRLWEEAELGDTVIIPLIVTEPEITTETLNSVLFRDLLGQKSTTLTGSSASRINNIKKAASLIDGFVLNPGEEFSYNDVVGPRTAARGFQLAGA